MHPDRKIGIAMGILLIGIVAALFFRNEPLQDEVQGLSDLREQQLNEKLRDRDAPLYLDADKAAAQKVDVDTPLWTQDSTLDDVFSQVQQNGTMPAPIGLRPVPKSKVAGQAGKTELAELKIRSTAPDQVAVPSEVNSAGSPVVKTEPSDVEEEPNEFASILAGSTDAKPAPTGSPGEASYTEYVVQYGDTLSEISEKFLGSQTRYKEIYEVNKDRMDSPDRLRVGKAIRIPRSLN